MFQGLTVGANVEVKERDSLGGGGVLPTGLYPAKINHVYVHTAESEAMGFAIELDINGKKHSETIYVTSGKKKGKKTTYTKDGKEYPLPGFLMVNSLATVVAGKKISELAEPEKKILKLYDFESKSEKPTEVPVVMDLTGKNVVVAIRHVRKNKQVKNGQGDYVDTNEVREYNEIEKFFHPETYLTSSEIEDGVAQSEETFAWQWKDKFDGKVKDLYKEDPKNATASSAGGQAGGAAPTESLFN